MTTAANSPLDIGHDLMVGTAPIAAFLGWDEGTVYRAIRSGNLKTFRIGRRIAAFRSVLSADLRHRAAAQAVAHAA